MIRSQTPPFLLVAGARPNFMKIAPIAKIFRKKDIPFRFLNTGQHHDPSLSDIFLKELGLGRPDYHLEVGSGSHAQTTARVLEKIEPIIQKIRPRSVIVVGDVNSTLAAALAAAKLHFPVTHVEAGLRSGDRSMPEEINRIGTDLISDLLLTPSSDADANLIREGISSKKIQFVGNVMIDSLRIALTKIRAHSTSPWPAPYGLMTFHRPSNVDTQRGLSKLVDFLGEASRILPILLPLHPRTRVRLESYHLSRQIARMPGLKLMEPLGYFDFVRTMKYAKIVVTDSGGIQEETSYLGIPCLVIRTSTERPICIERGTTELMGENYDLTLRRIRQLLHQTQKKPKSIPLWDGHAARRIVSALCKTFPTTRFR